jgi:hypothetical protein
MWTVTALLGIDAEWWGVIVGVAGLALTAYAIMADRRRAGHERSGLVAQPPAVGADTVGQHSERSSTAAIERLAAVYERFRRP